LEVGVLFSTELRPTSKDAMELISYKVEYN
jgi:hypothetical protein